MRRTMLLLMAIAAMGFGSTSANAQFYVDKGAHCPFIGGSCDTFSEAWLYPWEGFPFSTFFDYDITAAPIPKTCSVGWQFLYDPTRVEFVNAKRTVNDFEAPVGCHVYHDPPPFWFPEATAQLFCVVEDLFADSPWVAVQIPSEVELEWRALQTTGLTWIAADWWFSYAWDANGRCTEAVGEDIPFPDMFVAIQPVPEPSELMMLGAGVPLLGLMVKRRGRQS